MTRTRVRAWDFTWEATRHLSRVGNPGTPSPEEVRVRESLGKLYRLNLPIEAIYELSELCTAVERVVKVRESD